MIEAKRFAAGLALAALLAVGRANAARELATLVVVDRDTGQELAVWRHHGRLYVAGEPGARYGLRVSNNTDGRLLAVMSVDGVNIVTGATATYSQGGYVLAPHQVVDVNGWRKSSTEVAAFSFTALSQSYAARTGRPLDVGVIGMAVFKEKPDPVSAGPDGYRQARGRPLAPHMTPPPPLDVPVPSAPLPPVRAPIPEAIAPPAPAPPAPPAPPIPAPYGSAATEPASSRAFVRQGEKLGTAHGPLEWSVSNTVEFRRATRQPQLVEQIEYDSNPNLAAAGVIPDFAPHDGHPRPFPSAHEPSFVPDPPPEQ